VIVVDASAMTEFLLQTPCGRRVEARLFQDDDEFHVPHLLDVEVLQALRRLVRTRELSADRAEEVIADLAVYVALAEAIEAPLVTCDGSLGKAPGHTAHIEVIR
jgi:predicted nucleic acid-binding protein